MNMVDNTAFRIGQWRIDPALDEISRDGTTLKLEPRTMRVLTCLAGRAGQVVSINELLDTVWKDLVVTQDSVYQAVAALRRALGDDPKDPSYIASVARRGYRLLPPVEREAAAQAPLSVPAKHDPQSPVLGAPERWQVVARGFGWRHAAALAALTLLVLAAGLWWALG